MPVHYDFSALRLTPQKVKSFFKKNRWNKVIGFQTRNPLHKAHFEMIVNSMNDLNAKLLLHPAIGMTKPGDINQYTRVRCYEHILKKFPDNSVLLSLLPLAMRMAGPKEALLHAIIRKNYGCSHFIVGRDHAGPGKDRNGFSFYKPYEAQDLIKKFEEEIGIKMIPFNFLVYVPKEKRYQPLDKIDGKKDYKTI